MLIRSDARARAEAAAGPTPLALEMLRAARRLSRAEAGMPQARDAAGATIPDPAAQRARAELEAAVARFCGQAAHRPS